MKLNYKIVGEGKPVVILHGLFGSLDNWMSMARAMAMHGIMSVLVDLRNHGHSPHAMPMDYRTLSDDVRELMQMLKLPPCVVLGHSMGGKVAMFLSMHYPQYVSKLVVIDIAPRYYPPHHDDIIAAMRSVDFDVLKTRSAVSLHLAERIVDEATRQFLLKNIYWNEQGVLAWRFGLDNIEDAKNEIGEQIVVPFVVGTPALFLAGSESSYITDDDKNLIDQQFANPLVVTIEGAGHWVHADQPNEVLRVLLDFIGK